MDQAGDRPSDELDVKPGEPGSEDQFARGAAAASEAPDTAADLVDEIGADERSRLEADETADQAVDETASLRRELEELRDKYLRLAAEFDNFRKRTSRERAEVETRAQGELVRQMLEVIDDLGRFSLFDPATTDSAKLAEGIDLIERKLQKTLTAAGLAVINPVNEPFDPAMHEALATEPALSPEDDNLVSQVYQVGYLFGGQLLRPARVVVKQWNG